MRSVRDEKADRQMDRMLSRALTQQAKPDAALQQKVCSQWKERREMNGNCSLCRRLYCRRNAF